MIAHTRQANFTSDRGQKEINGFPGNLPRSTIPFWLINGTNSRRTAHNPSVWDFHHIEYIIGNLGALLWHTGRRPHDSRTLQRWQWFP
jgi:hypothetical protein